MKKLPRFSKNASEVLYESEWVRVSFVPHEHEAKQVQVEFHRVPVPGFQCGAGDAHELGQALYHVGRQILLERHGHGAAPMPGYDAPRPVEDDSGTSESKLSAGKATPPHKL